MRMRAAGVLALILALALTPLGGVAEQMQAKAGAPTRLEATPFEDAVDEAGELGLAAPSDGEAPAGASLMDVELTLGVGQRRALTIAGGLDPRTVGAVFTSSNPKVARVNARTGVVAAKRTGSACIVMTAWDGVRSLCAVRVLAAPSKVALDCKKLALGVGECRALTAFVPEGSATRLTYHSSRPDVARVDANGNVVALSRGAARITVKTHNGKRASCRVSVKAAPKSVVFRPDAVSLWVGDSLPLEPVLSRNSAGACAYAIDDPGVLALEGDRVRALTEGEARVTATTYNGVTATLTVKVCPEPVYRALLIGEARFPGTNLCSLPAAGDVVLMERMLGSVKGARRTDWQVTARYNRTAAQIRADIDTAFSGAREGDVALFYISTHGDSDQPAEGVFGEYAGCLSTCSEPGDAFDSGLLTLSTLAEWLSEVPGRVVVVLDSCGSGAAILENGASNAARFDRCAVDAFRSRDGGVTLPAANGAPFVRANKFYVLTATAYLEQGWYSGKYSLFTRWLAESVGAAGRMPADADGDGLATLGELYACVRERGERLVRELEQAGETSVIRQHAQVYPSNSAFVLFRRDQ